jgi:hypothetical protein
VDTIAPLARIVDKPADPTNLTSAHLTFFSIEDGSGAREYRCKLDTENEVACSSPVDRSGLVDGSHTFSVYTVDRAGNTGATVSHSWTVDTQAPLAAIGEKPANPTSETTARFTFIATDSDGSVILRT